MTQGTRSPVGETGNPVHSRWPKEPWVLRVTPDYRSHPILRTPGVTRYSGLPETTGTQGNLSHSLLGLPESPGTPGSRSQKELRVPETPGTLGSSSHPEIRVSEINRNSGFAESPGGLRVPGFTQKSGSPESTGNPVSRSHKELWVSGVTRGIQGFRSHPKDSGFSELTGTPDSRS